MKKIVFITPSYYPSVLSGSGVVVTELAEGFARDGYNVSVITSNALTTRYWYDPIFGKKLSHDFEIINNVKIYRLGCNQILSSFFFILVKYFNKVLPKRLIEKLKILSSGPYLIGLYDVLRDNNFDVIHCSPFPLNINQQVVDSIKDLTYRPKLIFTPFFHSQNNDFSNLSLQEIFDKADSIHVISQVEKEEMRNMFHINESKIKIIPLFLKLAGMHTIEYLSNDIKLFKEEYRLKEKKIILFAGIKGAFKGACDLLQAINILYKSDKNLILIAMGSSTPEWENIKKIVNKNCLLDFSYTQGKEKEVIFGACDVFCMPSKTETFGLVYLEAWHKKKPIIAANIQTVKHIVKDAGLFVEFGNINSIVDEIKKISYNKTLIKKMGLKGYNRLITFYDFSKIFPRYVELFES